MKKCSVIFEGGQSRNDTVRREDGVLHYADCNYMICNTLDHYGDEVELYAEYLVPDDLNEDDFDGINDFECESYTKLKTEILKQAAENDVDVNTLDFSEWDAMYWDDTKC